MGPSHAGFAYDGKGMYDEAIAVHEKAAGLDPSGSYALAYSDALAGRTAEARKIANEFEKGASPNKQYFLAAIHAALGDTDEAFRWIEAANENRNGFLPWLNVPLFERLRGDPRFSDLLRRLKLPLA